MRRYRIGRAETNDVVLADPTVSREHAELVELGEGRFRVKDLGSTYGIAVMQGADWQTVTEAELEAESRLRIGDCETTVADLLRDADRTVVRPHAAPHETAPPAPARTASPAPPRPAPPRPAAPRAAPPRPAAPSGPAPPADGTTAPPQQSAPPRPAAPSGPASPADDVTAPPRPAAPSAPALQFLRNLPPDKRVLVWLGAGFAGFLLVALITLILALVL